MDEHEHAKLGVGILDRAALPSVGQLSCESTIEAAD